jgi:universal stress protein A
MKTIIVAVDFSPVTAALGRTASAFARRLHARLVLVHGVEVRPLPDETGLMLEYTAILAAGAEQSAHRRLARLAQRLKASGLAVDTVCRLESPAALVTGEAARRGAAFIILGSHGHTAFFDLIAGSTAHRILRMAECPVLVVPARRRPAGRRQKMHSSSQRPRSRS